MVDDYSDFIEDYVTSGIANQEFLQSVKENGIDAILISELSNVTQKDGAYGMNKAQTRVTLSFTMINTATNDVIWSASADGIRGSATTISEAPPIVEAINLAIDKIQSSVPNI